LFQKMYVNLKTVSLNAEYIDYNNLVL